MKRQQSEQINSLCRRCIRFCKQPATMLLLSCPRYQQRPFKTEELKFQQLELFSDESD
ncbi:MAG: hypothetical protein R6V33_01765 [Pelovirga sp.]